MDDPIDIATFLDLYQASLKEKQFNVETSIENSISMLKLFLHLFTLPETCRSYRFPTFFCKYY